MRKLFLILGLLVVNSVYADTVGVRISGGLFDYAVSGTVRDSAISSDQIDVKNTLGWTDEQVTMGYLYFEHPVPIIPNIRFGITSLNFGGTGSGTFTYNGVAFTGTVTSNLDLSHTELALYYEVIDTGFDLDLGLNFKFFDGDVNIREVGGTAFTADTFKETIPMLYAAVTIPIPGTGFRIAGDLSTISYDNNSLTDYFVRVRYETSFVLGLELGYRSFSIDYQDTGADKYAKIDAKGPYAALHVSF